MVNMCCLLWTVFCSLDLCHVQPPIVTIRQGTLQGSTGMDMDGNKIYSFRGIPYAKAPVEELRFQPPQLPSRWKRTRDATAFGQNCPQAQGYVQGELTGAEDCLFLNVFTRELPGPCTSLKPVMVWIHGGGYNLSLPSIDLLGPEFLLVENIVLVTFNYRLGILGYARARNSSIGFTGNYGFKDQVAALEWVRDNIAYFNGDPHQVTLFGESAGAASVHFHTLSPLSRGLFHRVILQSGSALANWADSNYHDLVDVFTFYGQHVADEAEALDNLKSMTLSEILKIQLYYIGRHSAGAGTAFGLNIEQPSVDAFISSRAIDIIRSGNYQHVPMMIGANDREGTLFQMLRVINGWGDMLPQEFIPHNIDFYQNNTLRNYYLDFLNDRYFSGPVHQDNIIWVTGDFWINSGVWAGIINQLKTAVQPVYIFNITWDVGLNLGKNLLGITDIAGCTHLDDIGYLFKTMLTPVIVPGSVQDVSWRQMVKLWTNFAKYSNPTPTNELGGLWPAAQEDQLNVQNIGNVFSTKVNPVADLIEFWSDMYHQSTETYYYF